MTLFSFTLPPTGAPAPLSLTEETDLEGRAAQYSLWQYQDKPKFQAMLRALVSALQPLESLAFDVYEGVRLDTAIGAQLEILGKIVGWEKGTKTDEEYRAFIRGKILANRSNGTLPETYAILDLFTLDAQAIQEYPPAAYVVEIVLASYPYEIFQLLAIARPGGVDMQMAYTAFYDVETFQVSSQYPGEEYDNNKGAGGAPYAPNVGGHIMGVFA